MEESQTRRRIGTYLGMTLMMVVLAIACGDQDEPAVREEPGARVQLVPPRHESDTSVEEALLNRRSVREYTGDALTLAEVSQLLWAAQGTNDPEGFRTAPSAGALYPLEVYVVVGDVTGLAPGVYRYLPDDHEMVGVAPEDRRDELAKAAVDQEWVEEAAIDLVFTAVPERTTSKYGDRGVRYVWMEVGHAAQNVYLQAGTMGLGVTVIGAFDDDRVHEIVAASAEEQPLYVISVGRKA
ncbi:MAG: SagB/ThcOx family dehydrogenase [Acidimicrobiia bacterium]